MKQDSQHIQNEIEETQSRIDQHLDRLSDSLDVRRQLDGVADWAREKFSGEGNITDRARRAGDAVADNPTATVLGVVSAAAAIASKFFWSREATVADQGPSNQSRSGASANRATSNGPSRREAGRHSSSTVSQSGDWRETFAKGGRNVRNAASSLARVTRETASTIGDRVADAAEVSTEKVKESASAVGERFDQGRRDYPMAVCVGAVATGVIAALLLPRSRREDELCGEPSDQLKRKAQSKVDQLQDEAAHYVEEKVEAVKDEAARRKLDLDGLKERAEDAIDKGSESATELVDEQVAPPKSSAS